MNNSTATEFVKVVVAGLDYSANGGGEFLPRMVLQKALTSANEVIFSGFLSFTHTLLKITAEIKVAV